MVTRAVPNAGSFAPAAPGGPAEWGPAGGWSPSVLSTVRAEEATDAGAGVGSDTDRAALARQVGAGRTTDADRAALARRVAASVTDPEVPVLTIEDLGILRGVEVGGDHIVVTITPTYSGCPAVDTIRDDLVLALSAAGFAAVEVRLTLAPAWTTDWMSEAGKRKLEEFGIAPPTGRARVTGPIPVRLGVRCPRCGSLDTREVSHFGSTSCKALYECRSCLEPFDHFKVH